MQRGTAKWNSLTYLKDGETKTDVICKDCEEYIGREVGRTRWMCMKIWFERKYKCTN